MLDNIPEELRQLPQWVVTSSNKVPINPRTGWAASVTDPGTWATFGEAAAMGLPYIGFVLTPNDPYTIIDLDNKPEKPATPEQLARHYKILDAFDSYTERSASGTGYHIIVKGSIPSGVHRGNVEVYSSGRYMICTGDVVRNSPILEYQQLLNLLYGEMAPPPVVTLEDHASSLEDEDVLDMALRAVNGDKFDRLCQGDWRNLGYTSQSEADFALLSMFAFYTPDNDQVRRLFRMSALGQREKAQRNDKYLDFGLSKIRAQQPPMVDASKLVLQPPEKKAPPGKTPPTQPLTFPPGLVGQIADYILKTSIRPVPEIALGAAIALVAGVCGRSYNISGSGLNQYLILLAKTGAGKEGAVSGIDNIIAAARPQIPMVDQFIGPGAFASGQALIKVLDERPCFVSVLGEFGLTLRQLCDPRASGPQIMLKKVFLDLFSKSGWTKILRSSVYSDVEKNTKIVQAPNVTILGESTPESFFEGLDSSHISEGLIPRFSLIEYTGPRPPRNLNANLPPSTDLVSRFCELVTVSLTTSNNHTCAGVRVDEEAEQLLDAFDARADAMINSAGSDVDMQLWNRAHLKALKLAALLAVGCSYHNPVVTRDLATWAISFVERDVMAMATRFQKGEVGTGDHRHEEDLRKAFEAYLEMGPEERLQYKVAKSLLASPVVPFHYLRRRLRLRAAFKNDRRGAARALEDSLNDMVKAEILQVVSPLQAMEKFKVTSELYIKGPSW